MSIVPIADYSGSNPRIDGMKLLYQVQEKVKTDLIQVISPVIVDQDSFLYYVSNKEFNREDIEAITTYAKGMFQKSKTGLLVVRRAYLVPGLENPPGPRYIGLKDVDEVIGAIKGVFDFAINQGYNQQSESKIEAFFYPFIDPPKLSGPLSSSIILPRGGYGVAQDHEGGLVKLLAVFGNNEGVQSLDGVDEYVVNMKELTIVRKYIAQKQFALCTTDRGQADKVELPLHFQFSQIVNDLEILEIARMVEQCTKASGHAKRLEFSSDQEGISMNEAIDHRVDKVETGDYLYTGNIITVEKPRDMTKVKGSNGNQVIYIAKSIVEKRSYDLLNAIASFPQTLHVLYPGTAATSHAMRVLIDSGHRAFVVGAKQFHEGEEVTIEVIDGNVEIYSNKVKIERNIIPLSEGIEYTREAIGGKAYNLARLIEYGYTVPEGYVLKTNAYRNMDFFKTEEFRDFIDSLDSGKSYAVRSSANIEDSSDKSLAGEFDTVLGVKKDYIQEAIVKVWESVDALHLKKILHDSEIASIKMAVVIQELVDSHYSGVTFGSNIQNRNSDQVLLEITEGYAEGVVDGKAQVRRIIFDKLSGSIKSDTNSIALDSQTVTALFKLYMRIEELFGTIQDVEWTIDHKGRIFVLQSRDLRV